jgi:hypothetical protein
MPSDKAIDNWSKDVEMVTVLPEDKIPQKLLIGENYHTTFQSSPRFRFKLISHGDVYCKLKSHFTGSTFDCKITNLRETNRRALENANRRIKNYKK